MLYRRDSAGEHDLHMPSKQIGECGPATTMGHVYDDGEPRLALHARIACFRHGGHVRQRLRSHLACYRQRAQLAFLGVGGLFTLENATRVKSDLSVHLYYAHSVTDEPARQYELTI